MMLPTQLHAASAADSHLSQLASCRRTAPNTPEEDDETMSKDGDAPSPRPYDHSPPAGRASFDGDSLFRPGDRPAPSFSLYQPPLGLPAGYSQPTPFPTPYPTGAEGSWLLHPSFASGWTRLGYPPDGRSCCPGPSYGGGDYLSYPESRYGAGESASLSGRYSPSMGSLEPPGSLRSTPPSADMHHHTLPPYYCSPQGAACFSRCPADVFKMGPAPHQSPGPGYGPPHWLLCPDNCRPPAGGHMHSAHFSPAKPKAPPGNAALSLEQRKVFVTYEADNEKHVNDVINFVGLLRHNGFDTHIDMFEQQFRSISKIDFMERYLSEKEYLIIIIISPRYYETVTASPLSLENEERTLTTVYIHKQLQNEFIQNGSKNFRFIPILFPGAKKGHVPAWLQNTHVYGWPRDRDDVLRRLMRVEKYNPPPIGDLPTIISIPI